MPSPVGHVLAGYAVLGLVPRHRRRTSLALLAVAMGIAPDLDFVPGLLIGMPAFYHQGPTHSLLVGLAASLVVAGALHLRGQPFGVAFAVGFVAYTSHLGLDALCPDARPPLGVPLLWPFSQEHVLAPVALLPGVRHAASAATSLPDWVIGVLHPANLWAVAVETGVIGPLAYWAWRRRAGPRGGTEGPARGAIPAQRRAVEESRS